MGLLLSMAMAMLVMVNWRHFNPTMNAQAGVFEQLPQGMDFKAFDPTHPTSAFDSFTTSVLRSIASGLNISYHSLSNDLTSVNYSSIRQGALEDRSMYQIYQQFVIEHFVNPVFQSWLEMAISTGYINLPISKFDKFARAINYIPRSFAWIDPLKEMQANVIGYKMEHLPILIFLLLMVEILRNYLNNIKKK